VLALLRRESGLRWPHRAASGVPGERTLLAGVLAPSSAAGRSGRACSAHPQPRWIPTGFSRSGDPRRPDLHTDSPRSNANTTMRLRPVCRHSLSHPRRGATYGPALQSVLTKNSEFCQARR